MFVLTTLLLIGVTTMAICLVAGAAYIKFYISPSIDIDLDDFRLNFTSFVYYTDRETGQEVRFEELHGNENRVWVDYEDIPKQLIDAYISIEDSRFEKHNGVDWKRTIGAAINYVVKIRDNFGGGSTITQQLIKNITGDDDQSVKRKIQEVMRALELEKKYEKEDIIELYLNTIYLGQNAYGVKAAAVAYFGKELDQLTLEECAAMAALPKNPYKYDIQRFPDNNKERRTTVLKEMFDNGKITKEQQDAANLAIVSTENGVRIQDASEQSYFVDEVIMSVVEDLMSEKGYSKAVASQLVYTGGLKIMTTIDPKVQAIVDSVFANEDNLPGVLGKDGKMPQASMVISDPYTGQVVALYGGRGVKEGKLVLNRATRTKRAPGSAIKPLTVYAPAFEYGVITPNMVMADAPVNFELRESGWPKNYYNYYRGQMTMMKAVEVSNNPIPVQILQKMGTEKAFNFAHVNLGLKSLVEKRTTTNTKGQTTMKTDIDYSPLAMGGLTDGVTVQEMAGAYSAFTNNGVYNEPVVYTMVYDSDGNVLLDNTPESHVAMSEKTATYTLEVLKNVVTGSEGTGKQAALKGIEVGAKTGTTNDDKDRWFVGITPYYSAVVWFGYDTPQAIKGVGSTNPALAIWKQVMVPLHEPLENRKFVQNVELKSVGVCADSGLLPTEYCQGDIRGSRVVSVKIASDDTPKEYCPYHVATQIDGTTGMLANDFCPTADLKTIGGLNLERSFARSGVVIGDQKYVLPHSPSDGGYAPAGSFPNCDVHNAENDGNKPPEPEVPEVPTEPERPILPPYDDGTGEGGNTGEGDNTENENSNAGDTTNPETPPTVPENPPTHTPPVTGGLPGSTKRTPFQ